MSMLISAGLLCLSAQFVPAPVILDTDIGDDIDDTWALCSLLGMPEIDLKLIVVGADNTPIKARLVAKILQAVDRTDIPIAVGRKTSDKAIHQTAWLGAFQFDGYKGKVIENGAQAMVDAVKACPGKPILCAIGPMFNLADALKLDPSIAQKARVVAMAGSVHIGYEGKQGRQPEWNVCCSVESARAVFAAPWEITLAPLDTCGTLVLKGDHYRAVADAKTKRAKTVIENYEQWSNHKNYPAGESSVLFDTLAAYLTHAEDLLEIETVKLSIDDKGNTVPDPEKGRPTRCALRWKNVAGFYDYLVNVLVNDPPRK